MLAATKQIKSDLLNRSANDFRQIYVNYNNNIQQLGT